MPAEDSDCKEFIDGFIFLLVDISAPRIMFFNLGAYKIVVQIVVVPLDCLRFLYLCTQCTP